MFMFFNVHFVDTEEEPRIKRRRLRDSSNVLDLPNKEFTRQFRVSKEVFKMILLEIAPKMGKRIRSTAIPDIIKLACFFHALGGQNQAKVDTNPNTCVSQGTASKIVAECLEIFEDHFCGKWITLKMSAKEESKNKETFYRKTKVPSIMGCVDCTHIPIIRPSLEEKYLYQNESGSFSLNTIMICDANLVVRFVDARNPGDNEDYLVWQLSKANAYLKAMYDAGKRNFWLIGDTDLPLQPYLMTPYRKPTKRYEIIFNEKLVKAHKFIDECFKAIRNRFRCLAADKAIFYQPEKATKIVNICCAIHNACIFYKDNSQFDEINATTSNVTNCNNSTEFSSDEDDSTNDSMEFNNEADASKEALEIRKNLAECLQNSKRCT